LFSREPGLIRVGLYFCRVDVLTGVAVTLVVALGAGGRRFIQLAIVVELQPGVEAVGRDKAGVAVEAKGFVGEGFGEEVFPDRTGDMTAVRGSVIEVDEAFVAADPGAGEQLWGIAHEPQVGVVVGGAGLSAHFGQAKTLAEASGGAKITGSLHHTGHGIRGLLAEDLFMRGDEIVEDIAVFVFDAGNIIRFGIDPLCREHGICSQHFEQGKLAGAERHGRIGLYGGGDIDLFKKFGEALRSLGAE